MENLGFPKWSLASEKEIGVFFPSSARTCKRFDLLYCLRNSNDLKPFLLIECKKMNSSRGKAKRQVLNYNYFVQAPFLAIASPGQFELTSPNALLRDKLTELKELSPSGLYLGWQWWQGTPLFSNLKEILERDQ
ncbi:type I restriction enzyme HsdR N-terminal domain-containing protein [Candidatus Similichlamydia epinepheli]|uniref:type I restriction enzyme HsdR N-terminal domain-containing protein n=1 Tax=Candidatus Similichlamydia epinepheli TaxID=1903953 RepID=UPI000D3BBAD3|nr:type I restriction enzyme HsdR N-terminal domain-containing protein [Candidatus Similichlamydia epinepheli]